jgi:hypothetical protein
METWRMNKKQLISMWCGIGAICGLAYLALYVEHYAYMGYKGFFFRAFLVALVTAGLIVTFKDKKAKKPQDD